MRLALAINPDGTTADLDLDAPEGAYVVLRTAIENVIEWVSLSPDFGMYVDEEGSYSGATFNPYATAIVAYAYPGQNTVAINGPVVVCGEVDDEGDTMGLSEGIAQVFRNTVKTLPDDPYFIHLRRQRP